MTKQIQEAIDMLQQAPSDSLASFKETFPNADDHDQYAYRFGYLESRLRTVIDMLEVIQKKEV